MFYKNDHWLFCAALLGIIIFGLGCSETDIPLTSEAPFLFTDIELTNNISPTPDTRLTRGSRVDFSVGIAYTLAPQEDSKRQNLFIRTRFIKRFGVADTDTTVLVLSDMDINAASGILIESQSIVIPNDAVRMQVWVRLVEVTPDGAFSIREEEEFWPVQ
jgi:hypothetical protein